LDALLLREKIVDSTKWILCLISIGIILTVISFLLFLGVIETADAVLYGLPEKSLFGFEYQVLLAFGFYLTFLGVFLILPILDTKNRITLKKFEIFFLVSFIHGIELLIYSVLISYVLPPLDPSHSWFDYYILGVFLILFSFSPIVFRIQDFKKLPAQKILCALLCLIGIFLYIFSLFVYNTSMWRVLFLYGNIILYVGGLPLLVSYGANLRSSLDRLQIIWVLIAIIGVVIYLTPTLILNGLGPMSLFRYIRYFDFLTFGTIIILCGIVPLGLTNKYRNLINEFRFIWITLLFLGIIQVFISGMLVISTSYLVEIPLDIIISGRTHVGPMILGMTWDVFYINGAVMTMISLVFICPILFFETIESEKI